MTCTGDWNDVKASVDAAVGRSEVAVEAIDESVADRLAFRLRTISDEPGSLVVNRVPGPDPVRLEMRAHLGLFGDAQREARLLADVRSRLKQLQGRDVAPLPDGW